MLFPAELTVVRGAGDLATGAIFRLHAAGFPVIATETAQPRAVRRTVAFAQAIYDGRHTVEGTTAIRVGTVDEASALASSAGLPVLPNPGDDVIAQFHPAIVVDARLLKRPDAARLDQARFVVGLGPGFEAGRNCHAAVETKRGHHLGRVLWQGATEPNTGIPGDIAGYRSERLLRAPTAGMWRTFAQIGQMVERSDVVGEIVSGDAALPVIAPLGGLVRGLLYPGLRVTPGEKLGDIDPRRDAEAIDTISDKSLAVGGAVLSAVLTWLNRNSA